MSGTAATRRTTMRIASTDIKAGVDVARPEHIATILGDHAS